jgi:acyl-CoA hydrolase/DNA-binding XRE family transcriptional regulator
MSAAAILKRARVDAGLTQAELARRAGTAQSAVARYESGAASPSIRTLERLLAAAGHRLVLDAQRGTPEQTDLRGARMRRLQQLRPDILRVARRYSITDVRVFGSVARGEDTADSDIDLLVEVDEPLTTHSPLEPDDVSRQIGDRIAARVADGSTMQLGIGGVPDAVLASLKRHRGLRVWTEMFSDGVLDLHHNGCFDEDIPLSTSFVFGSDRLYGWIDRNRRVRMIRTERANDPGQIAKQRAMTSVNAALQVDLFAQANASRINGRIFSGFGGSTDFIVGALHSRGGHAYIALGSWHRKAKVSTVVPRITEPVTSFQHSAIVSEYGMARVFGNNETDQAHDIIEHVAHPDAREELRAAAASFGL